MVPFEESVGALAELRQAGKIRWVGLSNVSVDQIRSAETIVPVTSVQNRLNPFFREALTTGVLSYCTERGLGFLAYSPAGGRAAQSEATRPPSARLPWPAGWASRPTCWCWPGCWRNRRPCW